jgi:CheY-like chemotaxis protein
LPQTLPASAGREPAEPAPSKAHHGTTHHPSQRRRAPQPAPRCCHDDRARLKDDGRVLLVIEDDPLFARVLYDLAHELGFDCLLATTADEGMELAQQFRLAAVVLDVKLPDHSGLTVLDRLKHNPLTRPRARAGDLGRRTSPRGARDGRRRRAGEAGRPRGACTPRVCRSRKKFASEPTHGAGGGRHEPARAKASCSSGQRHHSVAHRERRRRALAQLRTTTFDCMVLDLTLPDASGYELLERMAADDAFAFPPVIVYTGRQVSADEEQQLRKYSRSIIIKGAKSPERLLDEVTLFLHQVEGRLPPDRQRMLAEARRRDAAFESRRILVVEDDVRNIFALSSVLEPLGGNIVIARNGREALTRLASKPVPDLVLMDIMMPEMDGITAMQEIRKKPELRDLPIIALTAKAMPDDQQRCLAAGASDYITKPIDVDQAGFADPHMDAEIDLEIRLLLEAIYDRYHYDFRSYAKASLKRRLAQACDHLKVTIAVRAAGARAARTGSVRRAAASTSPCRSATCSATPASSARSAPRCCRCWLPTRPSRSGSPAAARRGSLFTRHPAARRGLAGPFDHLWHGHQCAGAARRGKRRVQPRAPARLHREPRRSGATTSLSDYYHASGDSAIMDAALRRKVTFSDHSLATDNVFSEVHLVTCRNVLIYFDQELQNRALRLFGEALIGRGFLGPRLEGEPAFQRGGGPVHGVRARRAHLPPQGTAMSRVDLVVIGGSAGAIEVLHQVLGRLPADVRPGHRDRDTRAGRWPPPAD